MIDKMMIRGAKVHNLKNIDVDIAGVSGSGKSSLVLGVRYAAGSRRYLEMPKNDTGIQSQRNLILYSV